MNLLKWLTLGLAGTSFASFVASAPTSNNGNLNPCYPANLNAGSRSKQYGTSLLVYQDAETANECHPGAQGAYYYICPQSTNRPCGRMKIEHLDKSTRSESNRNNPCLEINAKAGQNGYFESRANLSQCSPNDDKSNTLKVKIGDKVRTCPIEETQPCLPEPKAYPKRPGWKIPKAR